MSTYLENYEKWLKSSLLSKEEKEELLAIKDDETEKKIRFKSMLTFGTGGLRGVMKMGMNAMNRHTVAYATQGLANLILKEGRAKDGVVVAYDCRNNSPLFAKTTALVLAGNGIKTYLFDALRPTPELSYTLRELKCVAGVVITASHNPKQYNGYKAYWDDGGQLPPEHAEIVSQEIAKLDIFDDVKFADYDASIKNGMITIIGNEIDEKYLAEVQKQAINVDAVKAVANDLSIVYSPLHGTGYKLVPEILKRIGIKHLYTVKEQMVNDGNFPTLEKPNPEYPSAFTLGIKLANEVGSDLIVATDPDADRCGVMTRTKDGSFKTITGNQMGALLADYIITAYEKTNTMPDGPYMVKSIVSTELVTKICEEYHIQMYNVLTGFKFIGEVIKNHEKTNDGTFLLGFEESYGYLKGTYARDKDAVVASMLICEMTAYYKALGMTLADALDRLFEKYGFYYESTGEMYMEGLDGPEKMAKLMSGLRENAPEKFGDYKVVSVGDYLKQTITTNGKVEPTNLPISNVLSYKMENGDVIVVRPSGTEPKVKFYYMLTGKDEKECVNKKESYNKTINALI